MSDKTKKRKIIIIRGNSGSGKSTVAKKLQRTLGLGTFLIGQDTVRREMLWTKDGADTKALPLLINLVKYGSEHCDCVILEGILNSVWYRSLFELIAAEYGQEIYAYYYDLPFEETLQRHQTKPTRDEFGEREMRSWWNEKDYIGFIPEKIFTKDIGIEQAIDMIINDIGGVEDE